MNTINNNLSSTNLLNNNAKDINLVNNKSITNENSNNSTNTIIKTDSIAITEKDENKINNKKAFDAFNEASSEYAQDTNGVVHLRIQYFMICDAMKNQGINVPSFNLNDNSDEATQFLPFIDKMKDFVKGNNITENGASMDKANFFDFCDLYKEKLVKYGCK